MSSFAGTAGLVGAILRRDRLRLIVWPMALGLFAVVVVASTKGLYPDQAALDEAARAALASRAAAAFNGPPLALDTIGGQIAFQMGTFGLTMVGLMSLLLVTRLTRAEEDSGRLELVRSLPVGREAPLAAATLVVTGVVVVVGALITVVLLAQGLPTTGSVALGTSFVALGAMFTTITAAIAQVSENPRVVSGTAGAVLGLAFVIRAAGDASGGTLSWLSPIGLAQKSRPYAQEAWWPLAICAVVAVLFAGLAVVLIRRRDFAAGLVAPRPGPDRGAPSLGSPIGLTTRLLRGVVVGWGLGVVAMAIAWGSIASTVDEFVADSDAIRDMIARSPAATLVDSYLATALVILSLLVAGAALQILSRARTDEIEGRAEPLLGGPVRRSRWLGSHIAVAVGGTLLAQLAGALTLGVTAAIAVQDAGLVLRLLLASLAYVPAVWLMIGIAVLLIGAWPRALSLSWGVWAYSLVIAFFGALLGLPRAVIGLSPFEHVPLVPAEAVQLLPLALLTLIAVATTGAGLRALDHRDLA